MGKLPAASAELRQELRQELLDLGFDAVRAKASESGSQLLTPARSQVQIDRCLSSLSESELDVEHALDSIHRGTHVVSVLPSSCSNAGCEPTQLRCASRNARRKRFVPSNENGNVSSNGSSGYVLPVHRVYCTAGLSVRYAMLLSRSALRGIVLRRGITKCAPRPVEPAAGSEGARTHFAARARARGAQTPEGTIGLHARSDSACSAL
jgi:hypothetical protein